MSNLPKVIKELINPEHLEKITTLYNNQMSLLVEQYEKDSYITDFYNSYVFKRTSEKTGVVVKTVENWQRIDGYDLGVEVKFQDDIKEYKRIESYRMPHYIFNSNKTTNEIDMGGELKDEFTFSNTQINEVNYNRYRQLENSLFEVYKQNPKWVESQINYIIQNSRGKTIVDNYCEENDIRVNDAWNAINYFNDVFKAPVDDKQIYQHSKFRDLKKPTPKGLPIVGREQAFTIVCNFYNFNKDHLITLNSKVQGSKGGRGRKTHGDR